MRFTLVFKAISLLLKRKLTVVKKDSLAKLNIAMGKYPLNGILKWADPQDLQSLVSSLELTRSQFLQDVFVLAALRCRRNGFFVEFGATDGITGSNSHMLEKEFGWQGILCEPSHQFHEALRSSRSAQIDVRCVSGISGQIVNFTEVKGTGLSSMEATKSSDHSVFSSYKKNYYPVDTVSLTDLLREKGAPKIIDYLSIDVEGAEYEILRAHDWKAFKFLVITVEHNYESRRQDIYDLLTSNGYKRVLSEISLVDDWYVFEN
tara:strand:+ start:465 stop:1250 length:786 start_codon:yes stop_codon:yes gene_type:complete